jgi:quercetin dioxygenase-like cupin family protein
MLVIEESASTARMAERLESPANDGASEGEAIHLRAQPSLSWRRMLPVLAMVAGLAVLGFALTLIPRASSVPGEPGAGGRPPLPAPDSSGLVLGGPTDVTVQRTTYEPGQTSGWHSHTGMHAVMVLSGTVTFYDAECRSHTYSPGDTYVGGRGAHLVRNETAGPVEMAVTYLFPAGQSHTAFHIGSPVPLGCDAA